MKAIKLFSVAIAMAFAMNASAQFTQTSGSKKASSSNSTSFEREKHITADFKIGGVGGLGGFGLGIGYQKSIYQYRNFTLAWDIANIDWSAPFNSPADLDILSLKTGLRVFSPSFCNDKLRVYTNLAMGYTCVLSKGDSKYAEAITRVFNTYSYEEYNETMNWIKENYGYSDAQARAFMEELDDLIDGFDNVRIEDDDEMLNYILDKAGASGKMSASHGFGLTWGLGVQYNKKWSLGYTLQYETAFKSKSHLVTISYSF